MPRRETLRVTGYREFLHACDTADRSVKREVRQTFRRAGHSVQVDSARRIDQYSAKSAAGYKTYVRRRGIAVEQSLRKTTGKRPDWGATQMRRGLVPALVENQPRVIADFNRAMEDVVRTFERVAA